MAVYNDTRRGDYIVERPVADTPAEHGMNVAARIISFIGSVIVAVVAVRFVFILLGANPQNAFANFIYSVSRPFVQPFYGLFNYDPSFTRAHFELASLIAIFVYALLTMLLVRLVTLGSRRPIE